MVNGVPREVPRDSIHHDSPEAFIYNVILWSSRTSKEGFFQLMDALQSIMGQSVGKPRVYHGEWSP